MKQTEILLKEMNMEAATTRKMLAIVPADKFDWKPHPKSMNILQLATHIAELPGWVKMALTTDGLDFAENAYTPTPISSVAELLACFEQNYKEGVEELSKAGDKDLEPIWTLRMGDKVFSTDTKGETIRHAFSQMVHHRAQLGVFLRLLNISIPGSYGPSADEMNGFM
ncbi:MAG: DinB family protein [Bacteroidia bacterium]|nr:DinB family protein [Bacteroidia bacterium]